MSPVPVTIESFESCAIPLDAWNHVAHLTAAWTLLTSCPFGEATNRMRRRIQAYDAHHGIVTTLAT